MLANYQGKVNCYMFRGERSIQYRICVMSAADGKPRLVIRLQDVETCKQWQSLRLQPHDFETAGSFLQNGSLENYAELFARSFESHKAMGFWSNDCAHPINDRVLELTLSDGERCFKIQLQSVDANPAKQLTTLVRELNTATKSLHEATQALVACRQAASSPAAANDEMTSFSGLAISLVSTLLTNYSTSGATSPPPATGSSSPPATSSSITSLPSLQLSGTRVCATIHMTYLSRTLQLTPTVPPNAVLPPPIVAFARGNTITFQATGTFLVSVSMGFYATAITEPKGSALFELQDSNGATLAANAPTCGDAATHIVTLLHVVRVSEGDVIVVCAKNQSLIGGTVLIQAL